MRAPGRAARFASFQIRCDGERASGRLARRGTGAGPLATAGAGGSVGAGAPCAIAQTGGGSMWEAWVGGRLGRGCGSFIFVGRPHAVRG